MAKWKLHVTLIVRWSIIVFKMAGKIKIFSVYEWKVQMCVFNDDARCVGVSKCIRYWCIYVCISNVLLFGGEAAWGRCPKNKTERDVYGTLKKTV